MDLFNHMPDEISYIALDSMKKCPEFNYLNIHDLCVIWNEMIFEMSKCFGYLFSEHECEMIVANIAHRISPIIGSRIIPLLITAIGSDYTAYSKYLTYSIAIRFAELKVEDIHGNTFSQLANKLMKDFNAIPSVDILRLLTNYV